jgi:hypothetical protein
METNSIPTPPLAASCTPLERRLEFWPCFFYTLVMNSLLRIFLWPYVPGSPHLFLVVLGTRIAVGVSWVRLYQYLTGEKTLDPLVVSTAMGLLPTILVDLGLGSCYWSCGVRHFVSQGYCKHT